MTEQNTVNEATNSGTGEAVKDPKENVTATVQDDKLNSGEDLQDLKTKMHDMSERMQQQSAIIGKLTNEIKNQNPKEEPKGVEKKTGEISQYQELENKIDKYESRFQKQERAAKLNEIELGLVEAGASPAIAKDQADYFAYKNGDKFVAEEDASGIIKHKYTDTDGTLVTMTQWAKSVLESDSGNYLKAQRTGPSVQNKGTSAGIANKIKMSSSDYTRGFAQANAKSVEEGQAFAASHSLA